VTEAIWWLITVVGFFHFIISFFGTKEVIEFPLLTNSSKLLWLILIWTTPILGTVLAHRKIGLSWASSTSTGGDSSTGGYGGSGGCDGGGGCG